jgi:hypothetical protein
MTKTKTYFAVEFAPIFYPAGQSPYGCPNGHRDNIYVDENHAECAVCGDTYRV